jgi:hypothetical protein
MNNPWHRPPNNRMDAARLAVGRLLVPPRWRSRLRYHGHQRFALWLDRICGQDTP